MSGYPVAITTVNHVEPVPRRIRAFLDGEQVDVILDGQRLERPQTHFFAR
jgi:hypothetical protein